MDAHTLLAEWEVSPFDGGFEGLRDLQARGFSGAVEVGAHTLFLRDGDAIAVVEDLADDPGPGDLDAFEGAVGDLYTAGRAETATLAAMLALDGEVRGQYFTEDTPLSTVHETLSDGGFTGYVELSENVLSGDYYVVYRDGREEYVAFVGSSNQVLVEDEARTRARGEVGIYSVVAVSLPEVELPGAGESDSAAGGDVNVSDPVTDDAGPAPADGDAGGPGEEAIADADDARARQDGTQVADVGSADGGTADGGTDDPIPGTDSGDGIAGASAAANANAAGETTPEDVSTTASSRTEPVSSEQSAGDGNGSTSAESDPPGAPADSPDVAAHDSSAAADSAPPVGPDDGGGDAADERQRAAGTDGSVIDAVSSRTVPSLDPQHSRQVQVDAADATSSQAAETSASEPRAEPELAAGDAAESTPPATRDDTGRSGTAGGEATGQRDPASEPAGGEGAAGASVGGRAPGSDAAERVAAVREEYEGRLEELRAEVEQLRAERDDLRRRVESLQSDAAGADGTGSAGSRPLSPAEAMAGTSLFVREGTRGGATLEEAMDGEADRETLAENVRIEYHTEFDDDGVTVDGQPFEAWLHETAHYRFVRWAIVDLPFEIRSTGSTSAMRPLVEALPEVDRIGLRDGVAAADGDGERTIDFDVVARNQMGDPLFVATIDESREPTAGDAIEPLVTDAADVCAHDASLAGTFAVTSSYFEPAALDTVREATSGSLLGRQKYRSYVKLARSNGFHCCMVEQRKGEFHLTVPEL